MTETARPALPEPAGVRQLDTLGGFRPIALLALATAAIIITDLFLLTPIYAIHEFYFTDDSGNIIDSGGFALSFLAIFLMFFGITQVFFRRSLWFGWVFLLVCLGFQTWLAAHQDIVRFFVNLQAASANNVFSGTAVDLLAQAWEQASRLLEYRYDPGLGSNRLGIGPGFAQSLVLNTFLLIGAIPLAFLMAAALWLVKQVIRIAGIGRQQGASDPYGISGYFPLMGAERTIAVYAGAVALLFATAAPMLALFITGSKQNLEELQNIIWIGPLVLMLEMARLALFVGRGKAADAPDPAAAPTTDRLVPRVHGRLQDELRRPKAPASLIVSAAAGGIESARASARDADDVFESGELRYFLETLTPLHFERLSALLASAALDRGRSALIVCPQAVKREVLQRFRAAGGPGERGFGEVWVDMAEKAPDSNTNIDVICCSPAEIETLLQRFPEYEADLRRLGAIFVLNLHDTDLGLLSLSLRRLHAASRHPGDLIYIAQSEPRIDQENRIQQSLPRTSASRSRIDLNVAGTSERHISVWPPAPDDSIGNPNSWPVEIQALFAAKKVAPDVGAYLWDIRGSFQANHWETVLPRLLVEQDRNDLATVARNLRPERLGPPPGEHPFALITANGNLADALALGIGNGDSRDAGAVVAMCDYPLARFHFDRLRTEFGNTRHSDTASREALRQFVETYASISPKPKLGPVELALRLANDFVIAGASGRGETDGGWLTQSDIESYWQGDSAEALRQLHINTTKTGLARLFRLCVGQNVQIEQKRHANLMRRYKLENPRQTEGATLSQFRVRTNNFPLAYLPGSDHGLSYADDTHMIVNNAMYRVTSVDPHERLVWVQEADGGERRYEFARSYAIVRAPRRADPHQAEDEHDIAVDAYLPAPNTRIPYEIAGGYLRAARHTCFAYRYSGYNAPFRGAENGPALVHCTAAQPARLRSAALLRLYGDRAGSRRSRRGAGSRNGNRQEACLAFTLATTLQDTLASLFPAVAHRIAVVTPQAAGIEAEIDPQARGLPARTAFALGRQPVLAQLKGNLREVEPEDIKARCRLSNDAMRAYEAYVARFFEQARSLDGARTAAPGITRMFSFLVIEDSDHDLGVTRMIVEQHERVFRIWEEFLQHCAKSKSDQVDHFYSFNSGDLSDIFLFDEALEAVKNMQRN